jgi:hypothetical protein
MAVVITSNNTPTTGGITYGNASGLLNLHGAGEPIENIYGEQHDPESAGARNDGYWENINQIDI